MGGLYPGGDDDDGFFCLWPISIYFGPKVLNMTGKLLVSALYNDNIQSKNVI